VILLDHVIFVVLAVVMPLRARAYAFGRLRRATAAAVPQVRRSLYHQGMMVQWSVVALTLGVWLARGRAWGDLGLAPRITPGLLGVVAGIAILALYIWNQAHRRPPAADTLAALRVRLEHLERMLPHTADELSTFNRLAITAGICEEILFRGFLLWYLQHALGPLPAAVLASVIFGVGHLYQGWKGVLQTGALGGFLIGVYVVSGSLYAGMLLHALMDLHAGRSAYLVYGPGGAGALVTTEAVSAEATPIPAAPVEAPEAAGAPASDASPER
jgi:membrane protease YdiL (CAAX protease family)